MKQFLVAGAFFLISFSCFSQQTRSDVANYSKADYDQLRANSRSARVTGIVLASGGGALIIGGIIASIVGAGEGKTDYNGNIIQGTTNDNLIRTGLIIAGAGVVAELVSIPFFVNAHADKKEAREMRIHMNSNSYAVPMGGYKSVSAPQLGVGLSIAL
jgi:hypothetical protein